MVDSFITYDANEFNLDSPSYLSGLRDDMFQQQFNFQAQNGLFRHNPNYPNMMHMMPQDKHFENISHTSVFSNPSTKDSPEHTPDADYPLAEDDNNQLSKVPPIIRKGIRKYYEPIIDNNTVYNYEDDPSEYRKARKRIQNRESATRVRNRKKNHVEILEDDITGLKRMNMELKQQNSALISENKMLKQQIRELEKTVPRKNFDGMMDMQDHVSHSNILDNNPSMLHMDKLEEDHDHNPVIVDKYYRQAPNSKFKKHMTMLGVFTLLLCVYGLLPRTESGTVQLFSYRGNLFGNTNNPWGKGSTEENDSKFLNNNQTSDSQDAERDTTGDQDNQDNAPAGDNQSNGDDTNDQFSEEPAADNQDNQTGNNDNGSSQGVEGPQFSEEPQGHNWSGEQKGEWKDGEQRSEGQFGGRRHGPPGKRGPHPPPHRNRDSKFEKDPVEIGHGPGAGPRPGHRRFRSPRGRFNEQKKGWNDRFNKKSASAAAASEGTSVFTMMEIVMVSCYSLYLLYVGFTAYKLHLQKRRDYQPAVSNTI